MGIDREFRVGEIKGRIGRRHFQVYFIKGANGPNVPPIVVKIKTIHLVRMDGLGNDIDAEIIVTGMIGEQVDQDIGLEKIDAHGAKEGPVRIVAADEPVLGFPVLRFLDEVRDAAILFAFQNAQAGGFFTRHRVDGDRDVCIVLPMELGHLGVVHAVQMVTRQDQDMLCAGGLDLEQLLADGIGGTLIPGGGGERLLGGPDLHPARMEGVEIIGLGNVAMEGYRIELRQDRNAVDFGVDAVADGNVDQAILARDRHSRFGAHLRQRIKTGAASAAHDDSQNIVRVEDMQDLRSESISIRPRSKALQHKKAKRASATGSLTRRDKYASGRLPAVR